MKTPLAFLALLVVLASPQALADCDPEQPGPLPLLLIGGLLAAVDLPVGTAIHEGSHALVVLAAGETVTEFDITPGYVETVHGKKWLWGRVRYEGELSTNEKILFFTAPKIVDTVILGGYAALLESDSLPKNKWAQLPLAVLATGAWIDFSKDLFATAPHRDQVKLFNLLGAETETERLPYRLLHGTLSVAAGIEVGRGIHKLFSDEKNGKPKTRGITPVITPSSIGVAGRF